MGIFRPLKAPSETAVVNADIEGEMKDFVAKAPLRPSRHEDSGTTAERISVGIQRVAGEPLAQIGHMIAELTQLRDHLQNESERVLHEIARVDSEIAGYSQVSEAAVRSIREIDQTLVEFNRARRGE